MFAVKSPAPCLYGEKELGYLAAETHPSVRSSRSWRRLSLKRFWGEALWRTGCASGEDSSESVRCGLRPIPRGDACHRTADPGCDGPVRGKEMPTGNHLCACCRSPGDAGGTRMIGDRPLLASCRELGAFGLQHAVSFLGPQGPDVVRHEMKGAGAFQHPRRLTGQHSRGRRCRVARRLDVACRHSGSDHRG